MWGINLDLGDDPELGVWPENAAAIRAWLIVAGQMRIISGGMGGAAYLGLDYAAARDGLELAGVALTPDDWARVRIIEASATEALNQR